MSPAVEARQILQLCGGDALKALEMVERQLNTLHARAQVLLSLAGLTVTVTGFSGRAIAATGWPAQVLIVAAVAVVLGSAVWVFTGVMGVRWVTGETLDDPEAALYRIVERRNRRTQRYFRGGLLLSFGLGLYGAAIALLLLSP